MDNIRVKEESLNNWRSEVNVDEGWKLAAGAAALAVPYLAKTFLKPKVDKKIEDARDNLKIGGNRRSGTKTESYNTSDWRNEFHPTEIESIDIIKAEPLVERDVYVKSNRNPNTGIPIGLKSGGIKDAGNDPVDVMKK